MGEITVDFGQSAAANEFTCRNPTFWAAFQRLLALTNQCFGRCWAPHNAAEDVVFNLGEACRDEFLEIAFCAVHGKALAALKLLRGLYERAVTVEYIRQHPDKAERFIRYATVQQYKGGKRALEVVSREQFDASMARIRLGPSRAAIDRLNGMGGLTVKVASSGCS